jgi:hypothetical protein
LTGDIFGEEYIPGQEGFTSSVAKSNVDAPGKRNDPATTWRAVIVNDVGSKIVSEQQSRSRPRGVEELRGSTRIQWLKMGLAIGARVESIKFHVVLLMD